MRKILIQYDLSQRPLPPHEVGIMAGIVKSVNANPPKIIKTTSCGRDESHSHDGFSATEFNLADLAEQGREQLRHCQRQVDVMLDDARQQCDTIQADAHAAGYAAGQQAAEKEIAQHIERQSERKAKAHIESLHAAVVTMKNQYEAWMQQYTEVLTTTAIAAAEQLTRSRLESEQSDIPAGSAESLLVRWAREALHSTRSANRLTLAVHPETHAQLGSALRDLLAHADLPETAAVIADETLAIDDVVVRQDGGEIHAGLHAQLERLREELR